MMLISPNGKYMAKMQTDGNFVVYYGNQQAGSALWVTKTQGYAGAYSIFGSDGNLVVYSSSNSVLWASNTDNYTGSSQLSLQM
jgi:Tol biopolymer transport system component